MDISQTWVGCTDNVGALQVYGSLKGSMLLLIKCLNDLSDLCELGYYGEKYKTFSEVSRIWKKLNNPLILNVPK